MSNQADLPLIANAGLVRARCGIRRSSQATGDCVDRRPRSVLIADAPAAETPTIEVVPDVPPQLTERFLAGVALAAEVHWRERRTGTEIPYLAHLLVVTGLVIEDGGDEDEAIAALLHDAVEDGGGQPMLERIERSFGPRVAGIVEGCSDTVDGGPSESWIERKRRYLAHLPQVTDDAVLRVALADKVHSARSIVRDYLGGPAVFMSSCAACSPVNAAKTSTADGRA